MKFRALIIFGMLFSGTANAGDPGRALAQSSVCLSCHQVDVKRVGPSFRDIGMRYAGNDAAAEYLARSIREGSRGLWGAIPMPAQRHVDPATAMRLANWIISLVPAESAAGTSTGDTPREADVPPANSPTPAVGAGSPKGDGS